MENVDKNKRELFDNGFTTIDDVFNYAEIDAIIELIVKADTSNPVFRKSSGLFAIRQFLKQIPDAQSLIFTEQLKSVISAMFDNNYFVVKSIYFDKPGQSNWFVSYHQDLTISVNSKTEIDGFSRWTLKQGQFAVQPTREILENNFTVRIHLDEANKNNGALKVIPKSHLLGVCRPGMIGWDLESETFCEVKKGGIMIMKPLLLHASGRSISNNRRRVIHIEFSKQNLPAPLEWSEGFQIFDFE